MVKDAMKMITDEEYEQYRRFRQDIIYGRLLTPEGLQRFCDEYKRDPKKIGACILKMLEKYEKEGRLVNRHFPLSLLPTLSKLRNCTFLLYPMY